MTAPMAIITPITGVAAEKRAQILKAVRSGQASRAYALAYSLFYDETGIRLPQPPNPGTARRDFYRGIGRDFARLPRMERDEILVRFYQFLKSMAPDFTSDRESIPLWVRILSGIIPFIAWFNALETGIAGLWHDFTFHVGAPESRAAEVQRAHDRTFRQHTLDFAAFTSLTSPLYWIAAPARYAAVRCFGWRYFRTLEVTA